ncbi:MAG: replication initiation factor [Gammaproteobacteria bacterium]
MSSDTSPQQSTNTRAARDAAPQHRPASGVESCQGTQSSNTVPSNCIDTCDTKILRTGIDSLYLSYQGNLSDESSIRLTELKKLAQSSSASSVNLAQFRVDPHVFEVKGNGRHPFAYILEDGTFRIEAAKQDAKQAPLAHVKISSELLTVAGADAAQEVLQKVIDVLGAVTAGPNVARVDLCVDFLTDYPLESINRAEFVTKARTKSWHEDSGRFSGFSFAPRAVLSARLYNKTIEMRSKNSPRPYLEALWRQAGWDGDKDVWRLEFQFRREALRTLDIVSYQELKNCLAGLWQYCTHQWLKHTVPNPADKTQSRWPVSSFWAVLQSADWGDANQMYLKRHTVERGRPPSDKFLFVNGLSPLTSFSAREGFTHAGEASEAFLKAAQDYHDGTSQITGVSFDDYYRNKVEEKRRLYNAGPNKPLGDGPHPADKAVSREYRKRSDGDY